MTVLWDEYTARVATGDVPKWVTDPLIGCGFVVVFIPGTSLPQIVVVDEKLVPNSAEGLVQMFFLQYAMLLSA